MLIIHLQNGNTIELPTAKFQETGHYGITYYTDSTKSRYVGSLTKRGDFVDAGNEPVRLIRNRDFTAMEIVARLKAEEAFSFRENDILRQLKRELQYYKPSSNKYLK